jgi:Flp pilus assembly protein TadB
MPTSTNDADNNKQPPRQSRLEAEIEEILTRTQAEKPLPPPTPFRKPRRRVAPELGKTLQRQNAGSTIERWVTAAPLFTALALAILAVLIRDLSPLLTRGVIILAMVALFWPFINRWRRPSAPSSQMWRGRTMDIDRSGPSPLDEIRRWFRNRR